ncbi:TscA family type II toxin-antitoxin system antitoxin [Staphylococcus simiae]|uniref:Pathogenicity island protein n=1 Tax=Staphylococcus simiae CCM 7213 = CCUG 51256 TaxID=911238 RepID=G5JFZ5_9STAP|nr:hypothetical protein [Staphylococcus simiae]EHJ08885.1 pathogenicity island protein [Staphylococcus simiae CCM 7213 = CCUG 51256]PNZ10947.1 hypothetical protein CD113_09190 [Staphylococcus simiae]SNV60631.1 pathogenicity island protein [Staphylococcus simiae]
MEQEQLKVIREIYDILESAINDKRVEYVHKVNDGKEEWQETINREDQLQFVCEVILQQIENNFEWENENEF